MRIVYVEDNQANVFLVKRVARMGGHDIINYIDGEEALSNITRDQPNLILMDIQLAGEMSGLQVVEKLREDGFEKPIIAVTAYAMVGDRERCLTAGCNDYIAKPLSIPLLIELMDYYNGKAAGGKSEAEAPAVTPAVPTQAAPQINGTGVHAPAAAAPAAPPPASQPASTPTPTPGSLSPVSPTPVISVSAPVPPAPQAPTPTSSPTPTPTTADASALDAPTTVGPAASTAPTVPSAPTAPSAQPGSPAASVQPTAVYSTAADGVSGDKVTMDNVDDDSEGETEILNIIVERKPETSTSAGASDDQSPTMPSREVSESTTKT